MEGCDEGKAGREEEGCDEGTPLKDLCCRGRVAVMMVMVVMVVLIGRCRGNSSTEGAAAGGVTIEPRSLSVTKGREVQRQDAPENPRETSRCRDHWRRYGGDGKLMAD
ncbi:hypothetical protein E2C01_077984 [Portunus trituberculatus]|uniref:Uncharacterized protein n=1 Tax=Portunus trituberculatus TaxID=210409 RepID=A0A5B7INT9_PORTR|nr:hypothetical protein [Portunus trituberculatus]